MATSTKKNTVTVTLSEEKQTKNTVRFTEKLESEYDVPVIGTLYVPKATLAKLGSFKDLHIKWFLWPNLVDRRNCR